MRGVATHPGTVPVLPIAGRLDWRSLPPTDIQGRGERDRTDVKISQVVSAAWGTYRNNTDDTRRLLA